MTTNDAPDGPLTRKLAPEAVATALIRAGALLTGYELVKASILEGVHGFIATGFDEQGLKYHPAYEREVLPMGKNAFEASLAWLVQLEALSREQVAALEQIRRHRHELAHELARFLVDPDLEVSVERLHDLHSIMRSLDRFWGGIEVDIDPEIDKSTVNYDDIRSGSGLLLDYLMQLAGLAGPPAEPSRGPSI